MKVIEKHGFDVKLERLLRLESRTMDALLHANIIRLFHVVETLSHVFIVMEYAEQGTLFQLLETESECAICACYPQQMHRDCGG